MDIVWAALAAAVVGALGPWVIARVPEPPHPDADKPLYADIARVRGLAVGLALVAALLAAAVAAGTDRPALLPVWIAVVGVGVWLSWIDLRTRLLPYALTSPLWLGAWALVGIGALIERDSGVALAAVVANIGVYLAFRLLYLIGLRFGGALGYGDVRLAAVLAVALGPFGGGAVLVGLYAGFVLGAVLGLLLSALRIIDRRSFAFGPYLLAGAVIGVIWGPRLYGA